MEENSMKEVQQELDKFKLSLELFMENYFSEKIREIEKVSSLGKEMIELIQYFTLSGGKRIRGMLVYQGYLATGGEDTIEKILPCATGVELMHAFFLIHDDIIDKSDERRNQPTVHKLYENLYKDKLDKNQHLKHFTFSMAIMVGDLACALAYQSIIRSLFPAQNIIKALELMHNVAEKTTIGEGLDILGGFKNKIAIDDVYKIQELKTAKYTIEGPLLMGAALGEGKEYLFDSLSAFAIPAGIAFQIQDDILGIFGSKEKVGKSISSDIIENKKTLLIAKAIENANDAQKNFLYNCLGNASVNDNDMNKIRDIIRETGSLAFSQEKAYELVKKSKAILKKINIPQKVKDFLSGMADYMIVRKY